MTSHIIASPAESSPSNVGAPAYGNMNQVSSGPAGILYTLANQLMVVYNELQTLNSEMTVAETNVQSKTIKAAADAQITAAANQAWSIGCQAIGSLASAGASAFSLIGENMKNSSLTDELGKEQPKLDNLNKLQEVTRAPAPNNPVVAEQEADLPPTSARSRAEQLLQDCESAPGTSAEDNRAAYESMTDDERIQFKKDLQERITAQEKVINTLQTKINYNQTTINTASQLISGVTNTASQAGQAVCTWQSGAAQAAKEVSNGVSQMAGGTAESTRSQIAKYYDMVASIIAAARSGAQAYAQT